MIIKHVKMMYIIDKSKSVYWNVRKNICLYHLRGFDPYMPRMYKWRPANTTPICAHGLIECLTCNNYEPRTNKHEPTTNQWRTTNNSFSSRVKNESRIRWSHKNTLNDCDLLSNHVAGRNTGHVGPWFASQVSAVSPLEICQARKNPCQSWRCRSPLTQQSTNVLMNCWVA